MAEPLSTEQIQELMAGYVLGNLSPEEAEMLRQQFAANPELIGEVQQLQEVLSIMPYALPEEMPSESLREKILATEIADPSRTPQRNRWNRSAIAWGSIAAALLVALGLDNVRLRQQITSFQAQISQQRYLISLLQAPNTQLVSLKGMDPMSNASGRAIIMPGQPEAILVLQNLPSLPEEKYYCLWAIVNGKRKAVAWFEPNSQGKVFDKVHLLSGSDMKVLGVTVELQPAPQDPTGPMVMTSSL